jgi:predicted Zn-dependent protease
MCTHCSFDPSAESLCEQHLSSALTLDPTDPEVYQTLASVRLSQSRPDDARESLDKAWSLWRDALPDSPIIPPFPSRLAFARLLLECELYGPAIEVLQGLEGENDEDMEVQYLLGLAWSLLGEAKATDKQLVAGSDRQEDVDECKEEARGSLETFLKVSSR